MENLLLTATIRPDAGLQKKIRYPHSINSNDRIKSYVEALIFYITKSNFSNIIFCDNSGYDLKEIYFLKSLAEIYDKNIEFLTTIQDQSSIDRLGYAFGEASLMDYVISNSTIIQGNNTKFWKITGRYICKNINEIIDSYRDADVVYFKSFGHGISPFSISTAIFKNTVINYKKFLFGVGSQCNTKLGIGLENVFYRALKENLFKIGYSNSISKPIPKFALRNKKTEIKNKIMRLIGVSSFGLISLCLDKFIYPHFYKNRFNQ